jgi:putative ABC transport system permease protein
LGNSANYVFAAYRTVDNRANSVLGVNEPARSRVLFDVTAFLADLRLAIRTLRRTPAFTATAILTLGVAMTLSTSVMTVVTAYLFRELPYPDASRLYSVRFSVPGQDEPARMESLDWTSVSDVVEQPIAWDLDMFYVLGDGNAESVPGAWVTPGFVEGLGIRPAFGRGFDAAAFENGSVNVALISHRLWQTRFHGDPGVLGQSFAAYVSDRPEEAERFTVIGVLPERFWHVNPYTDILVPLRAPTYPYMVRLRAGVTPERAAAQITSLVRAGTAGLPAAWKADLISTRESYVARLRPILRGVAAAAALVLLVGCANIAGLLLTRALERQRDIAVRTALGAGRFAIARMLIAEALVLGVAATLCALAATRLTLSSLAPLIQRQLGRSAPRGAFAFELDVPVMIAAIAVGLVTATACGLAPLLASFRSGVAPALQAATRSTTEGRVSRRVRSALIAFEVATSLALLSGSTLMVRSVVALARADLGFSTDRTLIASITLRQNSYPDDVSRLALFERIRETLGGTAGVRSVAFSSTWPLQQPRLRPIEGEVHGRRMQARAVIHAVSAAYNQTLDIPMAAGRPFATTDRAGSEPIAIVSETLARRLWPDGTAIGSRILLPRENRDEPPETCAIVGIVRDVRQDPADEDLADVYVPMAQRVDRFAVAFVRTEGAPEQWLPALRSAIHAIDSEIPLTRARTFHSAVEETRARPAFLAWLLAGFAGIAAAVALVGVYGLMAYSVRQREREIAVRIAVGADQRRITRLCAREGWAVLAGGLVIGAAAAIGVGRLLESQLFGVRPADPMSLGATVVAYAAVGALAVWWPARRAALTDPVAALRGN